MKPEKTDNLVVGLLTSPWTILVAVATAVFIGLLFKDLAHAMRPFGLMYLYMLQMTVIPIIVSAIISSVAGLAKSRGIGRFLTRMVIIFVAMLVLASLAGTLAGVVGRPGGGLDESTRDTLGRIVETEQDQYAPDLEISLSAPPEREERVTLLDFFVDMIPRNIFQSLSSGRALELIFFSIVFGIAVGVVREQKGEFLISIFDGMFKAFQKIISWLLVALPIGLIFLLADQIASTGVEILLAMTKFLLVFFVVGLAVLVLDVLVLWRRSREPLGVVLKAILDPIVVALVTRSSFATLPAAIKSLEQKLGFYERSTNLFFSLGITLGRFGNIIYFALASLFVAQLYGVDLGPQQYGIVVVGSLFAGVATAGATGIATLNLLAIVLGPLGLPLEAVLIIFMAIDTIVDPLRTLLIVLTNMTANSLIVPKVAPLDRRHRGRRRTPQREEDVFLDRIREKGEIVAAVPHRDIAPFFYREEDGALSGTSADVLRRVADSLGVRLSVDRSAETDQELVSLVKEGDADLALAPYGMDRIFGDELCYTEPYARSPQALLIGRSTLRSAPRPAAGTAPSARDLTGTVGVAAGSVHARTARRLLPRMDHEERPGLADVVDAVLLGELTAGFGDQIELEYLMRRRPAGSAETVIVPFKKHEDTLRLALAPHNAAFLEVFNRAVADARAEVSAGAPAGETAVSPQG